MVLATKSCVTAPDEAVWRLAWCSPVWPLYTVLWRMLSVQAQIVGLASKRSPASLTRAPETQKRQDDLKSPLARSAQYSSGLTISRHDPSSQPRLTTFFSPHGRARPKRIHPHCTVEENFSRHWQCDAEKGRQERRAVSRMRSSHGVQNFHMAVTHRASGAGARGRECWSHLWFSILLTGYFSPSADRKPSRGRATSDFGSLHGTVMSTMSRLQHSNRSP